MNTVLRKVSHIRHIGTLDHAFSFFRTSDVMLVRPLLGGCSVTNERYYKSMPTHGIGRFKYLLPKEPPKKKKDRLQMKKIKPATSTAYGVLNVSISGYDMTVVEHYTQYIHNFCNRFDVTVEESYGLPTKSIELMLMPEQGTKMYTEAVLKTHERVVQISQIDATFFPIFLEVIMRNQPEGVKLSLKEHTEADYQARFKARPELQGLLAQMSHHN